MKHFYVKDTVFHGFIVVDFLNFALAVFKNDLGVPLVAQELTNLTRIHEDAGLIPDLTRGLKDLALLWLWHRLAAVALIGPPSLGTSICRGATLKGQKTKIFFFGESVRGFHQSS